MTTPTPLPVPFMELNKEFVPVVYESWAAQMRAYGLAEYQRGLKDALAAHQKPLANEHIEKLEALCIDPVDANGFGWLNRKAFARAIEAAHGIE